MNSSCQHCNFDHAHRYTLSIYRPDDGKSLCRELRLCRVCASQFRRAVRKVLDQFDKYPPTTDSGGRSDQ